MEKVELLAPAGSFEKLRLVSAYGADAVYFGGKAFNLRARSGNFSDNELAEAVHYLHRSGKKGYVTLNTYQRNDDYNGIVEYLQFLDSVKPDGVIISNLGMMALVRKHAPDIPIHVSTQANITDSETARMWYDLGATRLILARELTIEEIRGISASVGAECEVFVHGAMCMAYSGRCLMSKYMTGRDANQGDCAHPCRWEYVVRERTRANELFDVEEDEEGMYIFNSKDLMLYDRLQSLIDAGVKSFKIEGRIKGILYLAMVVRAYRLHINALRENTPVDPRWRESLFEANNRGYHEGFLLGADHYESNLTSSTAKSDYDVLGYIEEDGRIIAKAPFFEGHSYHYFTPAGDEGEALFESIYDEKKIHTTDAKTDRRYEVKTNISLPVFTVFRYKKRNIGH